MLIADRLRDLMVERGLSQSELARRVGVSQATIYKLVSGTGYGSKHLHNIAKHLGTTPDYLEGVTDDPEEDADTGQRLASDELELLELYQRLTVSQRKAFRVLLRGMANDNPAPGISIRKKADEQN